MSDLLSKLEHLRYEELCALATAGVLKSAESQALFAHLDECAECSKVFAEYQSLTSEGMPLLVDLYRSPLEPVAFDQTNSLSRLLRSATNSIPDKASTETSPSRFTPYFYLRRGLIAASLIGGVALASYKFGEHQRASSATTSKTSVPIEPNVSGDRQKLKVALRETQQSETEMQALATTRGMEVEKLRADLKIAQERLVNLTSTMSASKSDTAAQVRALTEQRDAAINRLQDAERLYQTVQEELNTLRSQRKQDLVRIASLENQVGGLTVALNEKNTRVKDDEQYLASDKDIRDLIGARNLYIADIMDVREDGSSRKPFGRVFYTKTKSLIFYAYDLDRQPGVKNASTFQVWGRTGPADRKPLNLGVLYMDSETNRRWTLRVDNPEQLARLDAVFVTIEHERTDKPTGKPFLYASLRREPNHP
ncbi:MAG: hypothetical protein JWQ42_2247 [Edaphobacter sp.]|nr:hypothetical protein [Edaphobacter sp.]